MIAVALILKALWAGRNKMGFIDNIRLYEKLKLQEQKKQQKQREKYERARKARLEERVASEALPAQPAAPAFRLVLPKPLELKAAEAELKKADLCSIISAGIGV